jgi:hypothetical protein
MSKFGKTIIEEKIIFHIMCTSRRKGKAIPLLAWTDPEVSRRLRLPDFKTVGA